LLNIFFSSKFPRYFEAEFLASHLHLTFLCLTVVLRLKVLFCSEVSSKKLVCEKILPNITFFHYFQENLMFSKKILFLNKGISNITQKNNCFFETQTTTPRQTLKHHSEISNIKIGSLKKKMFS